MAQQRVSSDPGSAYLDGLAAELGAARSAQQAWEASLRRIENGLETWQGAATEVGDYNAVRYRDCKRRVLARIEQAEARVDECHRAIMAQQRANLADYEARVENGWAR